MTDWTIDLYSTEDGECPVGAYLDRLSAKELARVDHDLRLLEERGPGLGQPWVKNLGDKLWEFRTTGRLAHRIIFTLASGRRIVLLHAFAKKTQATPRRELATADRHRDDYQRQGKL